MNQRAANVWAVLAAAMGGVCTPGAMAVDEYRRDFSGDVTHQNFGYSISAPARSVRIGFFNRYDTLAGLDRITSLTIGWGSESTSPPLIDRDGTPFVGGIWKDLDNNPTTLDWTLVSCADSLITGSTSDDLMTLDIPDVTVSGLFYVGAYVDIAMVPGINLVNNLISVDPLTSGGQMRTAWDMTSSENPLLSADEVTTGPFWGYLRASAVPGPGGAGLGMIALGLLGRRRRRN